MESKTTEVATAVLLSGGLDSAVLVGQLLESGQRVCPIYIRCGFYWEPDELRAVSLFLATEPFITAARLGNLAERVELESPIRGIFQSHWSISGVGPPDYESPDTAVYLPGRNLTLLTAAAIWCQQHGVRRLALATLASNPFPDATDEFFALLEQTLSLGLDHRIEVSRPLEKLSKDRVMQLGEAYRLDLTFSCIAPVDGLHCGRCNKCAERQAAFASSGLDDRTRYASRHQALP